MSGANATEHPRLAGRSREPLRKRGALAMPSNPAVLSSITFKTHLNTQVWLYMNENGLKLIYRN